MRTTPSTYFFAWLWALCFACVALWGSFAASPLPFAGLRVLAASEYRAPMALFLLAAAIWYSMPRLVTRRALVVFSAVSAVLALIGFIFVSVAFGLACAFLAVSAKPAFWSPVSRSPTLFRN